jgi:hypothetical protein
MNKNTDFSAMLDMMWDLQVPIITVTHLDEEVDGQRTHTNHIIISDNKGKVTDFTFVRSHDKGSILVKITSLDMDFNGALVYYADKTLKSRGAILEMAQK